MSRRTHEGPMDFEYQNGTGPMDSRSPFANVGSNVQRISATPDRAGFKRSYSAFESPSRPSHAQPHHAATQPSSPSKNRPPVPAFSAIFATPRRVAPAIDDSSAGETPKSPSRDDSDATPDTTALKTAKSRFDFTAIPQLPPIVDTMERESHERRDSFFARFKKRCSPGRGEIPRGELIHAKENKVRKIRSRDGRHRSGRTRRNSVSSSASDDDTGRRRSPHKSPRKVSTMQTDAPGFMTRLFTFIQAHPTVPHILTFYAQLLFNVFLLSACAYFIYSCWTTIQGDIDRKAWTEVASITAENNACAENFRINGCDSATRAPALTVHCDTWALCMARDPQKIARARVSAHTFAEIFNSFVEPISWKAMIFTATLVIGCFAMSNCAFGMLRAKTAQTQQFQPQPWQAPMTPQSVFRGGDFYGEAPWSARTGLEPAPSAGHIEGRGSPVRRLAYG
ncbi:hypothetical protein AMS68_001227 [Peltaster fructicola]|uniref:Brl1/Brr6 domain-containing protein n=1 Tax=Peltaster fructicola TaxID=286661 RepID=A0A6H0XMJ0_9PEZI|nr:hypothetical protein AMS68_001227 [Peltaster fructicola]